MVSLADDGIRPSGSNVKRRIAAACLTGGFAGFGATNFVNTMRSATSADAQGKILYTV
jgi:hypothetical protein